MAQDAAVIISVRNLWRIHHELRRKLITKLGNWLARIILLPASRILSAALRPSVVTPRSHLRQLTILDWGFDLEVLAMARHFGYQVSSFEAPDWHDPKETEAGLVGDSANKAALRSCETSAVRVNLWRAVTINLLSRVYRGR